MTEAELYKELGALTKSREKWKENIQSGTQMPFLSFWLILFYGYPALG